MAGGKRKVALWTDPNGPALPSRLDDVLDGRAEGWIVVPMPGGEQATLSRRLTKNFSTRLQYGYFHYAEPSLSGANDYQAHTIFAVLTCRLP